MLDERGLRHVGILDEPDQAREHERHRVRGGNLREHPRDRQRREPGVVVPAVEHRQLVPRRAADERLGRGVVGVAISKGRQDAHVVAKRRCPGEQREERLAPLGLIAGRQDLHTRREHGIRRAVESPVEHVPIDWPEVVPRRSVVGDRDGRVYPIGVRDHEARAAQQIGECRV